MKKSVVIQCCALASTLLLPSYLAHAVELNPLQMAFAQPLFGAKQTIIGKWVCQYEQKDPSGIVMKTKSVDEYLANGQNRSITSIQIVLPQQTVEYKMQSRSRWQLLPNQILDHQQWRLTEFVVSDPEVEEKLKLRENLQQKNQFQSQIVRLDANQVVVRDLSNPKSTETMCIRE